MLNKNWRWLGIILLLLVLAPVAFSSAAAGQSANLTVKVNYLLGQPIADASVYLDGSLRGTTDANGILIIPDYFPGDHNLSVTSAKYDNVTQKIDASASEVSVTLRDRTITIPATATTLYARENTQARNLIPGAIIAIDGVTVGQTDNYGKLWVEGYTGQHTVTVSKKGSVDTTMKVDFAPGGSHDIILDRVDKKYSIFDTELFIYAFSKELALGVVATIILSVVAYAIGIVIGLGMGLGRVSKNRIIRYASSIYVEGVRGLPLVLQLLFIYYGLPFMIKELFGITITINGYEFYSAVIALSLNSGAYMAEIFKAGIEAIHKGQMEAARSVGMTYPQSMIYIILPQAFKVVLPALGNEFIALIKDSSISLIISYQELTYWAKSVGYEYYNAFTPLVAAGCLYLLITIPLGKLVQYIEKKYSTTSPRNEGAGLFGRRRKMGGNKPEAPQ